MVSIGKVLAVQIKSLVQLGIMATFRLGRVKKGGAVGPGVDAVLLFLVSFIFLHSFNLSSYSPPAPCPPPRPILHHPVHGHHPGCGPQVGPHQGVTAHCQISEERC